MTRERVFLVTMMFAIPFSLSSRAQQKSYILVEEAVDIAVENNANVQISNLEHKIANANYHQTDAIFLPQISVGYNAMSTNNPLNAFGFLLQQSSVTMQDFDPGKLNNPGATQNYGATIDAKVPLFNLDMIYARKGAKLQKEVYSYKAQYTKDYISFEVKKAYSQLQFAYQARNILQKTLIDVKQIHQTVSNFHDQGLVQKSDVLNALVQVNTVESALAKATSNISNASEGLALLMGVKGGTDVFKTDSLTQRYNNIGEIFFSPMRSDMMAMRKALEASNAMVKSSKMNFLPKINAFGNYQLNDSKAFKFRSDSYLVGLNLSWNIFSGNQNESKLKASKLQRDKMQKELDLFVDKNQVEFNKTMRDLHDLQVEIDKQRTSVDQASEALRIMSNRFKEGLVSTTDLLMSQAQLSQQELLYSQAILSYNITLYYLELQR